MRIQELKRADIPHDVDDNGHIWFHQKYKKIVSVLSFELTRDEFRPYKETIIPDEGVVAEIRPFTDMEGALFVTGYESKFGNFVTAVTLELASDKKLTPEDYGTIAELLDRLSAKYRNWNSDSE